MSLIKYRSLFNTVSGVRNFSRCTVYRTTYNVLDEKEILNFDDNLENYLAKQNYQDPDVFKKINIGFAIPAKTRKDTKERITHLKKLQNDANLKRLSAKNELKIPLEDVTREWEQHSFMQHVHAIANHYNIFDDLFGMAYFYPVLPLDISYPTEGDKVYPVYRGNVLTPTQTSSKPSIAFTSSPDSLWTLKLVGLDGHLDNPDSQYIHWMVTNISGNHVDKGNEICSYLQPFPLRGIGYQRYAFILYKQKSPIKLDPIKGVSLKERTFNTESFYRVHQDNLTPAGLSFFQSSWDPSVTKLFHNVFDRTEPLFEYDFPPAHHPKQEWFPLGKPFNLYLDRYRDPKQIAKEYLVAKFKATNPFQPPPPKVKYPNLMPFDKNKPSWLNLKERSDRAGWGRIKEFLD
uniref:Large ribosomal subunit protein mL38 n=1 Tax=Cacopsylla melanoneura TaxID=428564 RepID=A0A8D8LH34_9HEMI